MNFLWHKTDVCCAEPAVKSHLPLQGEGRRAPTPIRVGDIHVIAPNQTSRRKASPPTGGAAHPHPHKGGGRQDPHIGSPAAHLTRGTNTLRHAPRPRSGDVRVRRRACVCVDVKRDRRGVSHPTAVKGGSRDSVTLRLVSWRTWFTLRVVLTLHPGEYRGWAVSM